jgi:hypothetical protein
MSTPTEQMSTRDALDEVTRRGLTIYESVLKPILEPAHEGESVAIHVDTQDYAVARLRGDAVRALRSAHPDGALVILKIGSEPEHSLAARLGVGPGAPGANG